MCKFVLSTLIFRKLVNKKCAVQSDAEGRKGGNIFCKFRRQFSRVKGFVAIISQGVSVLREGDKQLSLHGTPIWI